MTSKKFSFKITKKLESGYARLGIIETPHGRIETPAFSPVATKATVKTLTPEEIKNAGSQVVLANTYHLYLQPGVDVVEKFGGFAGFMRWSGPTITDSGGYQVSFLWKPTSRKEKKVDSVKITDRGALFSSHIDGSKHIITPEKSMQIQYVLGADIIMAFDQPLINNSSEKEKQKAFKRTLKWEERSFKKWQEQERKRTKGKYQALFGIIHGGESKSLRRDSLKFVLDMDFPGVAVGGETIGKDPATTAKALDTIADLLPEDKPVHALGLGGGPEGIFNAIERGVDMFDNTSVTRMGRTGLVFIYPEDGGSVRNKFRISLRKKKYRNLKEPISKACICYTCQNYSLAYLSHLFKSKEILGLRLATIHNVSFINDLMKRIRNSIEENSYKNLRKQWCG